MRSLRFGHMFGALLLAAAPALFAGSAEAQVACLPGSTVLCIDQGKQWTNATRKAFYSQDQGSQMIPYAWMRALKTVDGQPFLWDSFARYGYLPDNFRTNGLPVGFTLAGTGANQMLGMTCAACHTRQLVRDEFSFRVDGGPAITDFQGLLSDMIDAVGRVRADDASFQAFATAVLGAGAKPAAVLALRDKVDIWYEREDMLRQRAYGTPDVWGLGRLDAVSMIFDRLSGLDLGPPPTYLIPDNIKPADAPVRYPFLWNAATQDITQWPGFSGNGTALTGLGRNTGEVFGVFATFHPVTNFFKIGNIDYTKNNSANWAGLRAVEQLIKQIGTPKWPAQFPNNDSLIARGKTLYAANCEGCHALKPIPAGTPGFPKVPTWATPLQDVGTDSREYDVLARMSDPGVLGKTSSLLFPKLKVSNPARTFDLLKYAVIGSILQSGAFGPALVTDIRDSKWFGKRPSAAQVQEALEEALTLPEFDGKFKYESRVMFGIWAAPPYLHNGSVPTMWDLLLPASQRPVTFAVGPVYDPIKMGLAVQQPGSYTRTTTDCADRNSGNSRCGHEFGTNLVDGDKRALIEFIKTI